MLSLSHRRLPMDGLPADLSVAISRHLDLRSLLALRPHTRTGDGGSGLMRGATGALGGSGRSAIAASPRARLSERITTFARILVVDKRY